MSDSSSSEGEDSWIQWFCGLQGHEMFCEVERGYIEDGFNLYGLRHWVPSINDSLDVILDRVGHSEASSELMEATYALYGLIHARYVLTTSGLEAMYAKYTLQEFGKCPHFLCRGQPVVPLGVRDEPNMETVKVYCPKCQDIYVHPSHAAQRVDGAYFGTTFPHLFFMTYGSMIPDPPEQKFVPRVFGFRVHASAANGAFARGQQASQQQQQYQQELQARRRARAAATATAIAAGTTTGAGGGTMSRTVSGKNAGTAHTDGSFAASAEASRGERRTNEHAAAKTDPVEARSATGSVDKREENGDRGGPRGQSAELVGAAARDEDDVHTRRKGNNGNKRDERREAAKGKTEGDGRGGHARRDSRSSRAAVVDEDGMAAAVENGCASRRDEGHGSGGELDHGRSQGDGDTAQTTPRCSGRGGEGLRNNSKIDGKPGFGKNSGGHTPSNGRGGAQSAGVKVAEVDHNGIGRGAFAHSSGNGHETPPRAEPSSQAVSGERGLKRSPSKELEDPDLAQEADGRGGGTLADGASGGSRTGKGKVPRSRNASSARGATTAAAALTAEGGAGSRRTRGGSMA